MRLRSGNNEQDRNDVPLTDLLRRLGIRGIEITSFEENGYQLSCGLIIEVFFFEDPVSEAEVNRIAELFGLDRLALYFDHVERDYN